jgi:hypothetical protein
MEVNGAGRAKARTVTFTGIGSIALLGLIFYFWDYGFDCLLEAPTPFGHRL